MITNSYLSPSKISLPPLMKVGDIAKLLSLSSPSVKALIENGDLEAAQISPSSKERKRIHTRVTTTSLARFYQKRFNQRLEDALRPRN